MREGSPGAGKTSVRHSPSAARFTIAGPRLFSFARAPDAGRKGSGMTGGKTARGGGSSLIGRQPLPIGRQPLPYRPATPPLSVGVDYTLSPTEERGIQSHRPSFLGTQTLLPQSRQTLIHQSCLTPQFPAFAAGGLSRRRGMLERPSVALRFFRRRKGRCPQEPGLRPGETQKV